MLQSEKLHQDPRVAQAKALLLEAIEEHSATLKAPGPSKPELAKAFEDWMERAADTRGRPMYLPYLGSGIGNGPLWS